MDFFDFREKMQQVRRPAPVRDGQPPRPARSDAPIYTVTQLTGAIDKAVKAGLPAQLLVRGEVSNYKHHGSSGHAYLTLKDPVNCIDCVMFRSEAARLKFKPADGMEVLVTGRIGIYGARGRYQLYLTNIQPLGQGALELAFQQMKAKLEGEGLFDPERKKPLPAYPRRIALLTSRQTAAVQDMLKVLCRFPFLRLFIYHVPVQGDGSAERIAEAIAHLNACGDQIGGVDVILLGRGGGSLEDLWEFNEECVARAICASRIPIVTGIGHEVDVSIADLVADYHAHTPTEAAQVITQPWRTVRDTVEMTDMRLRREMRDLLAGLSQHLSGIERHEFFRRPLDGVNQRRQLLDDRQRALEMAMAHRLHVTQRQLHEAAAALEQHRPAVIIARCREKLSTLSSRLAERHPRHWLRLRGQQVDAMTERLERAAVTQFQRRRARLDVLQTHLTAISPEQVLKRGYTITTRKKDGAVVRSAAQVKPGDKLVTRFADGQVESTAQDTRQLSLFDE